MQIPKDGRVLPHDHARTRSARFIVESLAQHIGSLEGLPAHLKDIEWTVTVVDHPMVNAMAAPGGHVLVFTGSLIMLVGLVWESPAFMVSKLCLWCRNNGSSVQSK